MHLFTQANPIVCSLIEIIIRKWVKCFLSRSWKYHVNMVNLNVSLRNLLHQIYLGRNFLLCIFQTKF